MDVWETARTIWENSHISYADLLDKLVELFGDDAPKSKGTISKRAKKEHWKKRKIMPKSKKSGGKNGNGGNDVCQNGNVLSENVKKSSKNNNVEIGNGGNDGNDLTVWQETQQKIHQEAEKLVLSAKQKSAIIFKHRKRVRDLGRLQDGTVAVLDTLHALDPELDGEMIARTITIAETLSRTTKQLSDTQKVLFEQEMIASGITLDDFKQSEQERRLESLQMLEGIHEEERLARERQLPMLQKRLAEFERLELGGDLDSNFADDHDDGSHAVCDDDIGGDFDDGFGE